jgi:hypothetical protein
MNAYLCHEAQGFELYIGSPEQELSTTQADTKSALRERHS